MAYIRGLERRLAAHQPIADVHSVASFFVSRVDTAVDPLLPEGSPLRGQGGGRERQARLPALRRDRRVATGGRSWPRRARRVQRTLWASTGTKNPEYSDVLYVDELIGPDCVNTMPEGTIAAFQDHGTVARTVDADVDEAPRRDRRAGRRRRVARRGHPQARDGRREVVLGLVRFADRDDPAESRRAARRLMATTAKRPAPNPLRAGLRVGGASEPTVFVIYGASGDLSQRKLLPAIYNLAVRGLLPNRFAVIGYARSEMDNDDLPRIRPHGGREVLANAGRRPPLAGVRREPALPAGELRRGGVQGPRRAPRGHRRGPRHRREPGLLPLDAGELLPGDRAGDGRDQAEQARRLRPGRHREAVRPRPGIGAGARRRGPPVVLREPDLPDRPLPGQGDGPEHLRVPVRQRDLRARLEQHARRPRPDHGRRVDRRRAPGGVLRGDRRRPRHRPEPPAPGARAGRDGAAGGVRRRPDPRREGEAPAGDAADDARELRARPVRRRATSPASRRWRTSTSRTSRPTRTRRPTSPRSSRSTTGAGRGRRSTSGPGSGSPSG